MTTGSELSFQCPFCRGRQTIRCGEFPYVRSQLIVRLECCDVLPGGISPDDLSEIANEIADALLAENVQAEVREVLAVR